MNYVTKEEFEALKKRVAKLEGSGSSLKRSPRRQVSIREFVLDKHRKTDIDKAICLIYFLEEIRGDFEEGISSNDLKSAFREAKERVPKNVSLVLNMCAQKCWINETGNSGRKKLWKITNTGIEYIENIERKLK